MCCAKGKISERKEQTNIVISNSKNNGDTVLTVLMYTLYLGSFQSFYAWKYMFIARNLLGVCSLVVLIVFKGTFKTELKLYV